MRFITLALLAFFITIGGLMACNSNEAIQSQTPNAASTPKQPPPPPADNARRINAADLHALYQKGEVVIVDTRTEKPYQDERIKGAILITTGSMLTRFEELPRNKMIVTYCT